MIVSSNLFYKVLDLEFPKNCMFLSNSSIKAWLKLKPGPQLLMDATGELSFLYCQVLPAQELSKFPWIQREI